MRAAAPKAPAPLGQLSPAFQHKEPKNGKARAAPSTRQCQRDPRCVRGFKHDGKGGRCQLQGPAAAGAAAPAVEGVESEDAASSDEVLVSEDAASVAGSSDEALEEAMVEFAAKKQAYEKETKVLTKMRAAANSEDSKQAIEAARRQAAASEDARKSAEAKAKADAKRLADLLADDGGVGQQEAKVKRLKAEKDATMATVKALSV